MDNPSRSERTRKAALQAALTIIARDGPGRLTLDAIAKEAGISKGGLMHQFPSKHAVLKALLEQQVEASKRIHDESVANAGPTHPEPHMAAQIMTMRKAATHTQSMVMAFLGAMLEEPALLEAVRKRDVVRVAELKAEARDPDLAVLRRAAARGLAFDRLFGLSALTQREEAGLFDRLLDGSQWAPLEQKRAAAKKPAKHRPR